MTTTVLVGGKYDPLQHAHLAYLHRGYQMGDWLFVATPTDAVVARTSDSGKCLIPAYARMELLQAELILLGGRGCVILNVLDHDGTAVELIRALKPTIFFKTGDRNLDNIPDSEKRVCQETGTRIVYEPLQYDVSSTSIKEKLDESMPIL